MIKGDLKRGALLTVEVTDLAFQGRGIARFEGIVVFVDGGLPGDTVELEITRRQRRHLDGKVVRVLEPSPDRIEARCGHFGICGGCRLQELTYEKQLAFKAAQVRNHLVRIGGLDDLGEIPIVPCDPNYGYRNKMEFAFDRNPAGELTVGLHPRGRYWEVFDLRECHLPPDEFVRIAEVTRRHFAKTSHQPYHVKNHTGFLRFLVVRAGAKTGQILVNLVTTDGDVAEPAEWVRALREAVPGLTTVVRTVNNLRANIAAGELTDIWLGDGHFTERLGELEFLLGPLSFFQTNTNQAERLFEQAIAFAELAPTDRVLDLYSGAGAISLFAARQAAMVTGVEVIPEATNSAKEAALRNGVENCTFVCADARVFLKSQLEQDTRYDAVIVDPPRAGLHPRVVQRLVELASPKIVYVSCNPATLARDLGLFCKRRYRVTKVVAVDMFPHTAHIETVALLRIVD